MKNVIPEAIDVEGLLREDNDARVDLFDDGRSLHEHAELQTSPVVYIGRALVLKLSEIDITLAS